MWSCLTPFFQEKSSDCGGWMWGQPSACSSGLCSSQLHHALLLGWVHERSWALLLWVQSSAAVGTELCSASFQPGRDGSHQRTWVSPKLSFSSQWEGSISFHIRSDAFFLDWVYLGQHCSWVILCFLYQNEIYVYFGISSLFQLLSLCLDIPTEHSQTY